MKKVLLCASVGLLSTGLYAQVGINTESPKATMDINVQEKNKDNDHLAGLLIPRVTKEKALKMGGNSDIQESTMIYVNDLTFTTPEKKEEADKVADIIEKGYYFWNGTKWVRSVGKDGQNEEWQYNPDNQRIELTRSGQGEFKNKVYFDKNGGFYNYDSPEFYNGKEVKNIETDKIPYINFEQRNAKEIFFDNTIEGRIYGGKTKSIINIDNDTKNLDLLGDLDLDKDHSIAVVNTSLISQTLPGYSNTLGGILGQTSSAILNGGNVGNLIGQISSAKVNSGYVKGYSVGVEGVSIVNGEQRGSWNDFMAGWFRTSLGDQGNLNVSRAKGILVETSLGENNINVSQRLTGISISSIFNENASGSIANQYGMTIDLGSQPSALNIGSKYGILMGNIEGGKSLNYAIYTNKGKVRFGDEVTVHAQGWSDEEKTRRKKNVLKIDLPNVGTYDEITSSIVGSRVDFNSKYIGTSIDFGLKNTNRQTNPFIAFSVAPEEETPSAKDMTEERMRITSSGNVGIGTKTPTEKLEVNGTIKATKINFTGLPTYENDTEAGTGGLVAGDCYKTSNGDLKIKL